MNCKYILCAQQDISLSSQCLRELTFFLVLITAVHQSFEFIFSFFLFQSNKILYFSFIKPVNLRDSTQPQELALHHGSTSRHYSLVWGNLSLRKNPHGRATEKKFQVCVFNTLKNVCPSQGYRSSTMLSFGCVSVLAFILDV